MNELPAHLEILEKIAWVGLGHLASSVAKADSTRVEVERKGW
jgi:hypothetical protein